MSSPFPDWPHNRCTFPDKHVVVCEDDISQQVRIAARMSALFGGQGRVQVSLCPGAAMAASVFCAAPVDLLLLDHDMPRGNGRTLLEWMASQRLFHVPLLTFSGLEGNNQAMLDLAASLGFRTVRKHNKNEVCDGLADSFIRESLSL